MIASAKTVLGVIGIILVVAFAWFLLRAPASTTQTGTDGTSTSTETTSDGTITFARPADFGLAVTAEQVLVHSYIPPCDEGFSYCLYYYANTFSGTNFESAGLSIRKRGDLTSSSTCLTSQPSGYSNAQFKKMDMPSYSISVAQTGEGAAGHIASGEEYRLFTAGKCYQFDARIGHSQFANYPAGTIKEFTASDEMQLLNKLRAIVANIRLNASGATVMLPQ